LSPNRAMIVDTGRSHNHMNSHVTHQGWGIWKRAFISSCSPCDDGSSANQRLPQSMVTSGHTNFWCDTQFSYINNL